MEAPVINVLVFLIYDYSTNFIDNLKEFYYKKFTALVILRLCTISESKGEKIKARMENVMDTITGRTKEQTTPIARTIVTGDTAQVTTTSNRILTSPKEIQSIKGTTRSNSLGKLKDYTEKMK